MSLSLINVFYVFFAGSAIDKQIAERILSPESHPLRFFTGAVKSHFHEPALSWADRLDAAGDVSAIDE